MKTQCLTLVNILDNETASSWVYFYYIRHVYHGCIKRTTHTCKRHEKEAHERAVLLRQHKQTVASVHRDVMGQSTRKIELHDCGRSAYFRAPLVPNVVSSSLNTSMILLCLLFGTVILLHLTSCSAPVITTTASRWRHHYKRKYRL